MKPPTVLRPETTSPELEAEEQAWWERYAMLEDRFAWVQTPRVQQLLRGKYVREIIGLIPKGGRILELGCGTGWLCLQLLRSGAEEVWGIDFSPAQIAIAREQAKIAGLEPRAHFICGDGSQSNAEHGKFDCVLVHAFLHHLDQSEIARLFASVPGMLKAGGKFIVVEPVRQEGEKLCQSRWERWQWKLIALANLGDRYRLRRENDEEKKWRAMLKARAVGQYPHGPSPKEMPFSPGELEVYLGRHFDVIDSKGCMAMSHIVVQEWLLREISHPWSTKVILPFVIRLAAWLDGHMVRQAEFPPGMWRFSIYICNYPKKSSRNAGGNL